MAWIPAAWGAEIVIGTVLSRCAMNRAVDVADQVTGVLFRMAGLGLGPYPSKSTSLALTNDLWSEQLAANSGSNSLVTHHFQQFSPRVIGSSTVDLVSELRALNTYSRVRFIHAVLQDAIRSFHPHWGVQKTSIVETEQQQQQALGECSCGSIICTSATLQEALRQLEEKLNAILYQLIAIADSIEKRKGQWWWSRLGNNCPYKEHVRLIALMLPEAEKNVQQLFAAIPWIQMTTTTIRSPSQ